MLKGVKEENDRLKLRINALIKKNEIFISNDIDAQISLLQTKKQNMIKLQQEQEKIQKNKELDDKYKKDLPK